MEFVQKDELGLNRTYYVVTELVFQNEEYVIYSDLLKSDTDEFRLLVGKIHNNKVQRVDKEKEDLVVAYFKMLQKDYIDYIKELL